MPFCCALERTRNKCFYPLDQRACSGFWFALLLWFSLSLQQRTTQLLSHSPSPVEENQKENAKPVGCDKNSLTEQQRQKKITTIILIKGIYSMQCSHRLMLTLLLRSKSPSFSRLPTLILSTTSHGIEYPI